MKRLYKKLLVFLILRILTSAIYTVINGFLYILMSDAINNAFIDKSIIINKVLTIIYFAVSVLIIGILDGLSSVLYKKKCDENLRKWYLHNILSADARIIDKDDINSYISRYTNDLEIVFNKFFIGIETFFVTFVNIAVSLWILFNVNIIILAISVFAALVSFIIIFALMKKTSKIYLKRSMITDDLTRNISDLLLGFKLIKTNLFMDKIRQKYVVAATNTENKSYEIKKEVAFISSIKSFVVNAVFYGVIIISGIMAFNGVLGVGDIILTVEGLNRFISGMGYMVMCIGNILSVIEVKKRIEQIFRQAHYENKKIIDNFSDSICLHKVRFSYENTGTMVFDDFSYKFIKNKKYLIKGPSGCGKTTLIKILLGSLEPNQGSIQIDRMELKDINLKSYYKFIAYVEQFVFLFEGTLYDNLTMGIENDEGEVRECLRSVGLEYMETELKRIISDNGSNISGGEKTRIAIARALLKKSEILILDEPFASLDYRVARDIEEMILKLSNITVICISHVQINENVGKYADIISL